MYPTLGVILANSLLYVMCQTAFNRDNSYIDVLWGPNFALANAIVWYTRIKILKDLAFPTLRMILVTGMVSVWAFRLGYHIL